MTKSLRQFFVLTGNQNLLSLSDENENFQAIKDIGETLIPIAANHYSVLANRNITDAEWTDLTVDPDESTGTLELGSDWKRVKSVINLMTTELYGKIGVNGLESFSEGGLSQNITTNYSKGILLLINSQKRMKVI